MKNFKFLFLLLTCAVMVTATKCKDDPEPQPPVISVTPAGDQLYAGAGDTVTFVISVSSEKGLKKVTVTLREGNNTTTVFDTTLTVNPTAFNYSYKYKVPGNDTLGSERTFTFSTVDVNDLTASATKKLFTAYMYRLMVPTTGTFRIWSLANEINNPGTDKSSAFNFSDLSSRTKDDPGFSKDASDSSFSATLVNRWVVGNGRNTKYVRTTNFNFDNANSVTVPAAYKAGTPVTELTNLQANQVIIVNINNLNDFAVVKITEVSDKAGYANDYYEFQIKKE
jgi:hypothetical protein